MDCARNIVTANFSGGTSATTAPLWQWDYGQVLCITGIDLPAAFEVHFSTNRMGGVSTVAVGADGQVTIPNDLLTIGKNLNAWIYLSDAQGEGETEYSITIPVKPRPMPETYDAEVTGEFDDVVRQVSEYAETAQAAADNAGASASAAAASADSAAASASAAETAKNAAETAQGKAEDAQAAAETAAQTATEKAQQTAQDAAQAAQSKADAESAAGRAEAAETGAESAKTDAETAAQGAANSASAAGASATSAGQAATSAGQSATAAAGSATTAENAAQTATTKAGEASASATAANTAKTAAQTAQASAETAATNAGQSASTATAKAAEAAQSASGAAQSKTDAEAAAARAEQAAASLVVDDALSDTSTNPVQNKVITGEVTQLKNAINNCTSNLVEEAVTLNGYYISDRGDISLLSSARNDSTIYVLAKPNKRYLIKKTNGTLLRVGLGASAELTSGRLSQYSGLAEGESGTLYVTTSDDLPYIYVMLFGASKTETIQKNIQTLAIVEDLSTELEDDVNALTAGITTVNEKVDTLRSDVFEEENIISVSADNMNHVAGDATITFRSSDSFDYARNSAVNNQIGFTFATEPQKTYTLTASVKNVSGGYVNVLICPTAIYNAGAALASQTNITVDTNISMTFTATTAETSLWFVVRYNVPQISVSGLYCTDGVLHFKHGMMDYSGKDITVFDKIICIGDSITEGTFNYTADGSNENVITIPKYSYPTQLKKMTGIDTVNMGHGGYTAVEWYAAHSADDLSGYDCAIIGFGINDALESVSMSDFTAAYHNIIDKLLTANPGIKVFLLTITPAYTDYNRRYDAYNTEIRRIAAEDYTNVYLVDLTQYSICKYNTAYAQGHLTAIGYMQMAAEIATIISYIIHANPSDFRNVQFIGTGYTYTA